MPVTFNEWPPAPDLARLQRYQRNRVLYEGAHEKVFRERIARRLFDRGETGLPYLVCNYPRVITQVAVNLLVGEPPVMSYSEDHLQGALDHVVEESGLWPVLLEAARSASYRGDACLRARRLPDGRVRIEAFPAYCYFVDRDPDNIRSVRAEAIAWTRSFGGQEWLRVEQHENGEIRQEAYQLSKRGIGRRAFPHELLEMLDGTPVRTRTGLPPGMSTIVHVPNLRDDDEYWGESDYQGLEPLFEEANQRLSQIADILDRHCDPKMIGPRDHQDPNGNIRLDRQNYFEVDPASGATLPRYMTWDAKLEMAFKAFEAVVNQIATHSETSPILFGYLPGARYDSGRAFRMQFVPTLSKTQRKRVYFAPALRRIVRVAVMLRLRGLVDDLASIPAPSIRWRDGLPKDMAEAAQTEVMRVNAGLTSRHSAIKRLDEADDLTADAELEQMVKEKSFSGAQAPEANINTGSADPAPEEETELGTS